MQSFLEIDTIGVEQIALGFAAFLFVCLGAIAIGVAMGLLSALITKYSFKAESKLLLRILWVVIAIILGLEPMFVFGCAYLSYLLAQMFDFSGMIRYLL